MVLLRQAGEGHRLEIQLDSAACCRCSCAKRRSQIQRVARSVVVSRIELPLIWGLRTTALVKRQQVGVEVIRKT